MLQRDDLYADDASELSVAERMAGSIHDVSTERVFDGRVLHGGGLRELRRHQRARLPERAFQAGDDVRGQCLRPEL